MSDYWNHDTAYHPELFAAIPHPRSAILDVGCGDGLLLQQLAFGAGRVVGIDLDEAAVARARARLADLPGAQVIHGDFLSSPELGGQRFDLITCVATLQHMPLAAALERMRDLLVPGGRLVVVGLTASKTARDWIVSGMLVLPIRLMSRLHREAAYPGMATVQAEESLADVRCAAAAVLPGSQVRRRFSYRYWLDWTKPAG